MSKTEYLLKQVRKAQKRDALTDETSAALADLADCFERCIASEAERRRDRIAYWNSLHRKELMQRLFGTSTVH